MELKYGDKFLEGLNSISSKFSKGIQQYLPNVGQDTNVLNQVSKPVETALSNPNIFPENKVGAAGDYIKAMIKNGVPQSDIEEFIRQYQFGNNMPGVNPASMPASTFRGKLVDSLMKMGSGISTGVMLPPYLSDIVQNAKQQQSKELGGA
jgi:hypothetical protein